jgi:hypothetical protein
VCLTAATEALPPLLASVVIRDGNPPSLVKKGRKRSFPLTGGLQMRKSPIHGQLGYRFFDVVGNS